MNPQGFWLLDLLRRRRELPLAEVVRLGRELPALLDAQPGKIDPHTKLLAETWIALAEGTDVRELWQTPVTGWPAFTLVLDRQAGDGEDATMVGALHQETVSSRPQALGVLLYELLGGVHSTEGRKRRYPPLPALNEAGNNLLRELLTGGFEHEACTTLWQRWLAACGIEQRRSHWRIPRWLLEVAAPGTQLDLEPTEPGVPPISLVARRQFRIGRSRSGADLPTRIYATGGAFDEEKTVQISRVQTLLEAGPEGLTLRDGDGTRASANGTLFNGEPLAFETPSPLLSGGELALGGLYRLAIRVLPDCPAPQLENLAEWAGEPQTDELPFSAVLFHALESSGPARDAVWLGRGLGFRPERTSGLAWETSGLGASAAHFWWAHGGFWLANASLAEGELSLNDAVLGPGQAAPLASGQEIEVAGRRFQLRLA